MLEQQGYRKALQPFTPTGVARLAYASIAKLLGVCSLFAMGAAAVVILLAGRHWSPVISEAVENLPTESGIHLGELVWPEKVPRMLGANEFLSIDVNPNGEQASSNPSDLSVLFTRDGVRFGSLLGFSFLRYPASSEFRLNKEYLSPLWGAWRPAIIVGSGFATGLDLLISWAVLGLIYGIYPYLVGLILNRDVPFLTAWKMAYAAQMPGALLVTFAILLYSLGEISLLFFLLLFAAHFVVSWIYIFLAAFFSRKLQVNAENPFETEKKRRSTPRNPFASGSGDD